MPASAGADQSRMADHANPDQSGFDKSAAASADGFHDAGGLDDAESSGSQSPGDAINAVRGLVEQVLEEGLSRVKGESGKLGNRASQTVSGMLSDFGVAQRRDHEDLELRIAQLEHRVRLLEGVHDADGEAASAPTDAAEDS